MNIHEPIYDDSMSTAASEALHASATALNRFSEHEIAQRVSMNRRELENVASDIEAMLKDPEMAPFVMAEFAGLSEAFAELGRSLLSMREMRDVKAIDGRVHDKPSPANSAVRSPFLSVVGG